MNPAPGPGPGPFSVRSALLLVLFGIVVFVALLWMIGNGLAAGEANDGGGHAEGRGLNGYAALSDLLERRGLTVSHSRSAAAFGKPGLLVLTPTAFTEGREIDKAVTRHRAVGPTLVITPKWIAVPVPQGDGARSGWVRIVGVSPPQWRGFLDDVTVETAPAPAGPGPQWAAKGIAGRFPDPRVTMAGSGPRLVPLVLGRGGRILAAYLADGEFPRLGALAPPGAVAAIETDAEAQERYPLVVVFEPDLLDNYGMARPEGARLADQLVTAMDGGADVAFDLTFNGHARSANLLTLAFTPPFLAATLCLLLAMAASGWRAFLRFGPPLASGRAIAFGKRALVANAAGLVIRSGRLHLLGGPYAEAARQRLARAFALPRGAAPDSELAAIDRAGRLHGAADNAFSEICARLVRARSARDLVRAAQDLHALERTLTP